MALSALVAWGRQNSLYVGHTSIEAKITSPIAGLLQNMFVRITTPPGGNTARNYTVYVNGVATLLAVTISGVATQGSNIVNQVAVVAGDDVAVVMDPVSDNGGPAPAGFTSCEIKLA